MITPHPSPHFSDLIHADIQESRLFLSGLNFTYKARGAIYKILNSLDKTCVGDTVLAPAFHCPTVVQPILMAGFKVKYFGINKDLSINESSILRQLNDQVAAVITINYFGFPQDFTAIKSHCAHNNCIVIEDCSHSFIYTAPMELTGESGDYAVYSFWKLLPSLAGGGIRINSPDHIKLKPSYIPISTKSKLKMLKLFVEQSVENMPDCLFKRTLVYTESLRVGLKSNSTWPQDNEAKEECGDKKQGDNFYPKIEELFSDEMPALSMRIINKSNFTKIIESRRRNYTLLQKALEGCNKLHLAYIELPARVCPWGFPIIVPNRHQYDYILRRQGVSFFTFGEMLHGSLNDSTCNAAGLAAAEYLSKSMLCISIHQDIDEATLLNNAQIIKEVIG